MFLAFVHAVPFQKEQHLSVFAVPFQKEQHF